MTVLIFIFGACLTLLLSPVLGQAPPDLPALLESLRAVGPEGRGNEEARTAWRRVAASDAAALPRILEALDGAGPSAANWIRTAADAVAGGELEHGGKLPAADLEAFILDRRHDPRARRLAFELLSRIDSGAPARLIPFFEDDPSVELRRDAVTALLEKAAAD